VDAALGFHREAMPLLLAEGDQSAERLYRRIAA
jgi:hypothetical protein